MAKKTQVGTIGGIRKMINSGASASGTTIAELGSTTVTLAQLKELLQLIAGGGGSQGNPGTPTSGSIALGPGLSGGGPVIGVVRISLDPLPMLMAQDGEDGERGPPGQSITGPQGFQGAPGISGDDGEDGMIGPPGVAGATGPQGPAGPSGSGSGGAGPPGAEGDAGDDAIMIPGTAGPAGAAGAAGAAGGTGVIGPAGLHGWDGDDGEDSIFVPPGRDSSSVVQVRGATWVSAGGPVITSALPDVTILIPEDCTITRCSISTNGGTGSCTVDVWATPNGVYPPTVANSICGGSLATISAGVNHDDTTLTNWNTTQSAGNWVTFHLATASTFTEITFMLTLQRTGSPNLNGYTNAQAIGAVQGALANTGNVQFTNVGSVISANFVATGTSHGANGFETLSSGLIIQWGTATLTTGNNTVTYPMAFPNNFFNAQVTIFGNNGVEFWEVNDGTTGVAPSLSAMNVYANNNTKVFWTAIGN